MKVLIAILIGYIVFKYQLWEQLVEVGFYVGVGWLIIKAYQTIRDSLM